MSPAQRYVSKELTHFVGKNLPTTEDQYSLLVKILTSGWLTHPPHNPNVSANLVVNGKARISENEMYSPQVICFSDIPAGDLDVHIGKYSRFGLSFLKSFLVRKGANPVFYIARNSTVSVPNDLSDRNRRKEAFERSRTIGPEAFSDRVPRAAYFDKMIGEYHDLVLTLFQQQQDPSGVPADFHRFFDLRRFLDFHIFSFLKFFDDAKSDEDPENYYMEREWRMLGNLNFKLDDVRRVILPESYATPLRKDVPDYAGQLTFVD